MQDERSEEVVIPLASAEDLSSWERLDDVIMGGQSSSALEVSGSGRGATWSGQLVIEGGGFCGTRAKVFLHAAGMQATQATPTKHPE